jgi:hypothetical protein
MILLNIMQQAVYLMAQFVAVFKCTAAGSISDGTVYNYGERTAAYIISDGRVFSCLLNVEQEAVYLALQLIAVY